MCKCVFCDNELELGGLLLEYGICKNENCRAFGEKQASDKGSDIDWSELEAQD